MIRFDIFKIESCDRVAQKRACGCFSKVGSSEDLFSRVLINFHNLKG